MLAASPAVFDESDTTGPYICGEGPYTTEPLTYCRPPSHYRPTTGPMCNPIFADMLTRGFEWTLLHGLPSNGKYYNTPQQPPCCSVTLGRHNMLQCNSTCWKPL